jgi:hypothetical protein
MEAKIPIYLTFPTGWWGRFTDSDTVRENRKKIKKSVAKGIMKDATI